MSLLTKKTFPLQKICDHVKGRLHGRPETEISGVCALDEQAPGCISFAKNFSRAGLDAAVAAAFFVPEDFDSLETGKIASLNLVYVKDPFAALISVIPFFSEPALTSEGINPKADIHPTARLGKNVSIAAFTVISARVEIGDNCVIHPNVTIYPDVKIGNNTTVHSNAVIREMVRIGNYSTIHAGAIIGSEGFGYIPDKEIGLRAIPQIGGVSLADRVDVGANSCIDRATLGNTTIGFGSKIDNLCQVGHNVKIGTASILCGQVGIAGSTTIGDRCTFAGSSGAADHVTIASDVRVGAKAAVLTNLLEKGDYAGHPAQSARSWHRQRVQITKLPELSKRVRTLEKKFEEDKE